MRNQIGHKMGWNLCLQSKIKRNEIFFIFLLIMRGEEGVGNVYIISSMYVHSPPLWEASNSALDDWIIILLLLLCTSWYACSCVLFNWWEAVAVWHKISYYVCYILSNPVLFWRFIWFLMNSFLLESSKKQARG